jgi:hypothetical protein
MRALLAWWFRFERRWLHSNTVAAWVLFIGVAIVAFEFLRAFARGAFAGVIR